MNSGRFRRAVIGSLLLIAVALPIAAGEWLRARHEHAREALQQDLQRLRAEERTTGVLSRRLQTRQRIEALDKEIKGSERLSARLGQLHRIAGSYNVRINKISYQMHAADAAGGIGRYDIRLETDAAYYELRFFLRDLLAADPLLALASLELRRPPGGGYNAGGSSILATLHVVMYLGSAVS